MKKIMGIVVVVAGIGLLSIAHADSRFKVCDHNDNPNKCTDPVIVIDPLITIGGYSIPFDIVVIPSPFLSSSTLRISVGTSTIPASLSTPTGVQYTTVTVTVTNTITGFTAYIGGRSYADFLQPSAFPLASLPQGSYRMTVQIDTPTVGSGSVEELFSF